MNLLMIHSDRDEMYGAVHSMLELLTNLNKNYNVIPTLVVSKEGFSTEYCKKMGWNYIVAGHCNFMMGAGTKKKQRIRDLFKLLFYLRYRIKNFFAIKKIEKQIDFNNIDLIHTNVNVCDIGAVLSRKHQIPHVWHLREFGDLDYNRIVFRKKYINFMNDNCDMFFAISNAVRKHWIAKGLSAKKVVTIYNGVDIINSKNNTDSVNNQKINFCFSGSISESKGQYKVIEALSKINELKLKKIHVDIIGDGPADYVNKLKRNVELYNLNDVVTFLGYQKNVRDLLGKYDVGLMCSRSEAFGRVTIEYMVSGLCVLASNRGANIELINDKKTGLLFDYENDKDLKEKIEWCIDNYSDIKKIGDNSQKYAISNFTSEINAKNIYSSYLKVLGEAYE